MLSTAARQASVSFIGTWLDTYYKYSDLPGLAVAIRDQNGTIFNRRWGLADEHLHVPLTLSHRFRFASHSKMFSAIAIMLLEEKGLLDLDDPVGKHLEWVRSNTAIAKLTIWQLLSHNSRLLRDGLEASFWSATSPFPDRISFRGQTAMMEITQTRASFMKYSNWGYGLIGEVIEAVSGMSYEDFITRRIIDPLNLKNTSPDASTETHDMATGYSKRIHGRRHNFDPCMQAGALAAATGIVSTPENMTSFLHGIFEGALLRPGTKRKLISGLTPMHSAKDRYIYGERDQYGLGFMWSPVRTHSSYGHAGSFHGFKSDSYYFPHFGISASICSTSDGGGGSDLSADELHKPIFETFLFFDHLQKTHQLANLTSNGNPSGHYTAGPRPTDIFCIVTGKRLRVLYLDSSSPWTDYEKAKITGVRGQYRIVDGNNGSIGESVSFDEKSETVYVCGRPHQLVTRGL